MELYAKGIYKSFGAGDILSGVDFRIKGGEICALLGENGAGKSTLMNIIGGILPADRGEILLDGKPVHFSSPADSQTAGIAFIHQELDLVNDLTVYENLFLSGFPKKGIFIDQKKMTDQTSELFEKFGIDLDPRLMVRDLDASYKQLVAISRALIANASLIIMDEPTSSLTPSEINHLFSIMRSLRERDIGMIFISHKLGEVMEICDRYTVLRNGTMVDSGNVADTDALKIASSMVGHDMSEHILHKKATAGGVALSLCGLSDGKSFFDISLSVRHGEILGVTGLLGDGRTELFETVFGINGSDYTGRITLNEKEIHPSASYKALNMGIAYVPNDRKENAVKPDMSILDNAMSVTMERFTKRFGLLDVEKQRHTLAKQVKDLHIKMSDDSKSITTLSGGNQQKVVLSEYILSDPEVLILNNPTQGVDIGAKEEIHSIIESLAARGIAIIVLSAEAQEIIRVCDRCLVMFHGRIAGELSGEEMNEKAMMELATGAEKGGGTK